MQLTDVNTLTRLQVLFCHCKIAVLLVAKQQRTPSHGHVLLQLKPRMYHGHYCEVVGDITASHVLSDELRAKPKDLLRLFSEVCCRS